MSSAEVNQVIGSVDSADLALFSGVAVGILVFMFVIAIAWYIVTSLGYFKMFKKAGAPRAWLAFLPLFRDYVRFKISWGTSKFWIYLVSFAAFDILYLFDNTVLSLLAIAAGIVWLVYEFKVCMRLAKSFGEGKACGVLLFFFPYIVGMVLGFGKAQYVGKGGAAVAAVEQSE